MCGICGYFGINTVFDTVGYENIKKLILSIEHRGKDATGIYTSVNDKIYKAPIRPELFFEYSEQFDEFVCAIESSNAVIMHNRLSTSGSPEINRNNQPFRLLDYVFAHNGVYWYYYSTYHERKVKKTKIEKISNTEIDNDSYELFKILFNKKLIINEKTITRAIEKEYNLLSYAISVYDARNNILYLSKDDEKPLYYLTDNRTVLIYCSESSYLKKLKKKSDIELKLYEVQDYHILKIYKIYNKLYIDKFKIAVDDTYTYKYHNYYTTNYKTTKHRKNNEDYYQYYYNDFEYFYK